MTIRMTGMMSGLDTDAIIKELMSAQSMKKTKIEQKKTKAEWKQEKWAELNKKIYALYTKQVSKMKLQGSYLTKKVTSSNEDAVTATATSSAATGSHTLEVEQLASSQYVTSGKVAEGTTASTKLSDLGMAVGTVITVKKGTATTEDEVKKLTIESDTTVKDFVKYLQDEGLNANFDEKQGRFFISSKESGEENAFTIIADTKDVEDTAETTAKEKVKEKYFTEDGNFKEDLLKTVEDKAKKALGLEGITELSDEQKEQIKQEEEEILQGMCDAEVKAVMEDPLQRLGLTNINNGTATETVEGMSIVPATDAKIILDGAELTDTSNSFSVAGLNLELKNVTTGKVSLNTTADTDAVYDSFKEFIKEYNAILEEMNTLYGADSARGYEPLTDEEKEAMSEEQIELWEKKIKDSLLRRDSTLSSLTSAMRTAMQTTIKASDGKTYSLSSFGIMTSSDYTEKGLLHIYGDEDDEDYGTEENKLKAALQENPDIVAEVLSGIVTQLANTMSDKMKGTEISSALTFYNDKEMKSQIEDYEDEITRWEDKLLDLEDRYYKQFSAMETALAKLNSQSSYLSSMLGTSA